MFKEMPAMETHHDEEIDPEDRFYDLVDVLGKELGGRWKGTLEPKINSGEMTYGQACDTLDKIIVERERVLHQRYVPLTEPHVESMTEVAPEERQHIVERLLLSNTEGNALGSGRVAEVYRVDGAHNICCKKVKNYKAYSDEEENSMYQEAQFLEELMGFEIDGARVPRFVQCFAGGDFDAILMEEVSGKSLEQLMNGDEEFPASFDMDAFFRTLGKFLENLHDQKGIYHLDIAPRNVMVDRETGLPVLIDFGRSRKFDFSEEVKLEGDRDRAQFEATRSEVKQFLSGQLQRGSSKH